MTDTIAEAPPQTKLRIARAKRVQPPAAYRVTGRAHDGSDTDRGYDELNVATSFALTMASQFPKGHEAVTVYIRDFDDVVVRRVELLTSGDVFVVAGNDPTPAQPKKESRMALKSSAKKTDVGPKERQLREMRERAAAEAKSAKPPAGEMAGYIDLAKGEFVPVAASPRGKKDAPAPSEKPKRAPRAAQAAPKKEGSKTAAALEAAVACIVEHKDPMTTKQLFEALKKKHPGVNTGTVIVVLSTVELRAKKPRVKRVSKGVYQAA